MVTIKTCEVFDMKMNKKYGILFAVLVFSVLLVFAGSVGQSKEPGVEEIKIGVVAPLTGGASTTGTDMWQSAVLAAEQINAEGGVDVGGVYVPITLVKGDTETSRESGVKAVTKLITEDKVDLLIGGFSSGITYADQVVAAEHKVPFIITGASSPIVTRRTDIDTSYFFHHCPTTDDYPEATLLFVNEVVKPEIYERFNFSEDRPLRLGVLYQDSKYGEGVYEGIKKAIEKHNLNMEIVSAEKFKMSETDFRTVLTVIKESKPDVVYVAAFLNEQTLIVTQGRKDVGMNTIYLSVECNDDPDYYTGVGRWGEYSIQESRFSPYAIPSGPIHEVVEKFREDFKDRWGTSPSMMGASTYEGVYIAAEAIKNAGTLDKEKVRASLAELEMPQIVEVMQNGVINFSSDYRESKFALYMEQLIWNESVGETRPKIVWPDSIKETDFVLPDWYEPGSSPAATATATATKATEECKTLWYFDEESQKCQQKEFCGMYMYKGLRTFETEEECKAALDKYLREKREEKETPAPEEPGFEAFLTIASLLTIAYMVQRRRK